MGLIPIVSTKYTSNRIWSISKEMGSENIHITVSMLLLLLLFGFDPYLTLKALSTPIKWLQRNDLPEFAIPEHVKIATFF